MSALAEYKWTSASSPDCGPGSGPVCVWRPPRMLNCCKVKGLKIVKVAAPSCQKSPCGWMVGSRQGPESFKGAAAVRLSTRPDPRIGSGRLKIARVLRPSPPGATVDQLTGCPARRAATNCSPGSNSAVNWRSGTLGTSSVHSAESSTPCSEKP